MFKVIFYNNKMTNYLIFPDGVIYNTKTHKNIYGAISNGYRRVQLSIEGKLINFSMHRLLAKYFIPNPENKPVVHHLDGNPLNNKIENLTWVTQQENCLLKNKTSQKVVNEIPPFTKEELENEIWKRFRDGVYEISNLGRKKTVSTDFITLGSQNKNSGYIRWNLKDKNGNYYELQAHRAVYEAFHPGEKIDMINHIDGNRANNRLSNIENISQSENVIKSYYETRNKKTVYIAQYDSRGEKLLNIYQSYKECAEVIGVANSSVVRKSIMKNYNCRGFKLKISSLEEYKKFHNI